MMAASVMATITMAASANRGKRGVVTPANKKRAGVRVWWWRGRQHGRAAARAAMVHDVRRAWAKATTST
jgi:hypothetical protein